MRKTLTLLLASTALTAAIGVPAFSAIHARLAPGLQPSVALDEQEAQALPLILASDDDDDEDRAGRDGARRGGDDDDDDDEDDDDDDDDGAYGAGAPDPAPAGAVAPPPNGLFGNGTAPKVQMN